ncbi:MAG: bacteriohopanetetrol glucosamine biosynthesis glycosyltransferase HpnI [Nevskia sp.]|nr:bacteriohopanetetrol glucosamine biosynthesis glycosyltransferase HpnI [Nevskia sp.]
MTFSMISHWLALAGTVLTGVAAGYAGVALQAVLRVRPDRGGAAAAPVSVLKPLHGAEPGLYDNLRSFFEQSHPTFQLVFGVRDPEDPAVAVVRRLQAEFPAVEAQLVADARVHGTNLKVSNLLNILPQTRHDLLVLADSDIGVPADYLASVTAPLADPGVGIVTCLYRGIPRAGFWSRLGALFIDDWFAPSVRVSHGFGSSRFGFGSTIALRRDALAAIGGFDRLRDTLADDFWLGELTRERGLRTVLSDLEVTTDVIERSLPELWSHELRWLRTIRSIESAGFAFLFVTFTFPLLALGLVLSHNRWSLVLAGMGALARLVLHFRQRRRRREPFVFDEIVLVPLRDTLLLAEWAVALTGWQVRWQNQVMYASGPGPAQSGPQAPDKAPPSQARYFH